MIDAAHGAGKWCGMCGGFASDTEATRLLLGMGLDEFSVVGSKVAKVKDTILQASLDEARAFADEVLASTRVQSVEKLISENPLQ